MEWDGRSRIVRVKVEGIVCFCADDINDEISRDMDVQNTYLNGFIINRVYTFHTQCDVE